jgi:hypothetical protein
VAARRACQFANALHLLPDGNAAHDAAGVQLYPHRVGIEIVEQDLNLKFVLAATSFNLHFAEVKRGPIPFQAVQPIDNLPAGCAFIRGLNHPFALSATSMACSIWSETSFTAPGE